MSKLKQNTTYEPADYSSKSESSVVPVKSYMKRADMNMTIFA